MSSYLYTTLTKTDWEKFGAVCGLIDIRVDQLAPVLDRSKLSQWVDIERVLTILDDGKLDELNEAFKDAFKKFCGHYNLSLEYYQELGQLVQLRPNLIKKTTSLSYPIKGHRDAVQLLTSYLYVSLLNMGFSHKDSEQVCNSGCSYDMM